jgi:hypothetical protein
MSSVKSVMGQTWQWSRANALEFGSVWCNHFDKSSVCCPLYLLICDVVTRMWTVRRIKWGNTYSVLTNSAWQAINTSPIIIADILNS